MFALDDEGVRAGVYCFKIDGNLRRRVHVAVVFIIVIADVNARPMPSTRPLNYILVPRFDTLPVMRAKKRANVPPTVCALSCILLSSFFAKRRAQL